MATLYYQKNQPFSQRVLLAFAYVKPICERVELANADMLPEACAGRSLPLVVDGEDIMDNSLEIMDWVLEPMEKASWIDWDLDEMDDSVYLLELCDGPFNDYLQDYLSQDLPSARGELAQLCAGFLAQLESLLQDSAYLMKDEPMLVDFAILPFVACFVQHEPQLLSDPELRRLKTWLQQLLADPVCNGILAPI